MFKTFTPRIFSYTTKMKELLQSNYNLPPMISYAQAAEDVVLRRGLHDVTHGFYVDLGAGSPDNDSVTRYFYDHGWNGINIEPQPHLHALLEKRRPRDVNLQLAVAAEPGERTLATYGYKWGWASISRQTQAMHANNGMVSENSTVQALPLSVILAKYAGERHIDFLKIDIEGGEKEALESLDFYRWSPTIICIEATKPGSPEPNYQEWEPILTKNGYTCALFDGLNRFYTKDTKIAKRIEMAANAFDKYIPYRWWRLLPLETRKQLKEFRGLDDTTPMDEHLSDSSSIIDWL